MYKVILISNKFSLKDKVLVKLISEKTTLKTSSLIRANKKATSNFDDNYSSIYYKKKMIKLSKVSSVKWHDQLWSDCVWVFLFEISREDILSVWFDFVYFFESS